MTNNPNWPSRSLGFILLAIWLIITGAVTALHLTFDALIIIQAIIAIAAGFLLLLGK